MWVHAHRSRKVSSVGSAHRSRFAPVGSFFQLGLAARARGWPRANCTVMQSINVCIMTRTETETEGAWMSDAPPDAYLYEARIPSTVRGPCPYVDRHEHK